MAVATGADWLASQALPAYELFMGSPPRAALAGGLSHRMERVPVAGRKLALVGLMGAGKTRTAKALSELLGAPYLDLDQAIEAEAGMSPSEIFSREGEAGFRARERRALDRVLSEPGRLVLASGGGAPTEPASSALLRESCLCVWLHVGAETAARRTGAGTAQGAALRPLLAGDGLAALRELEETRRPAYAACAELLVSTEGRSPAQVAEVIHDEIDRAS
jgi:shikimate kinase